MGFGHLAGHKPMCRSGQDREGSPFGSVNKRKPFIDEQIKGGFETMNKNLKKVISAVATVALSASSFAAFAIDFPDVESTASYAQAVQELSAIGVISGVEEGGDLVFKPDNLVTRAEITILIAIIVMAPPPESFSSALRAFSA